MFIVRVLDLDDGKDRHFGYTNIEMAKAKVLRERENKRFAWIRILEGGKQCESVKFITLEKSKSQG